MREIVSASFNLALSDLSARYRRTFFGPLWLIVGGMIGIFGLALFWSEVFQEEKSSLVPYIVVGLVLWQFISSFIIDSAKLFLSYSNNMKNIPRTPIFYIMYDFFKNFLNFVHSLVIVILVLIIFPPAGTLDVLALSFGFLSLFVFAVCALTILSFLGAKFKDVHPLLIAITPLIFFITPIIFRPEKVQGWAYVIEHQPIAVLINLIRYPLVGKEVEMSLYLIALIFNSIFAFIATYIYRNYRYEVIKWL